MLPDRIFAALNSAGGCLLFDTPFARPALQAAAGSTRIHTALPPKPAKSHFF
jgi:hypothetical protein